MLKRAIVRSFSTQLADLSTFREWITKTWKCPISRKSISGGRMLVIFEDVDSPKRVFNNRLWRFQSALVSLQWWLPSLNHSLIQLPSVWWNLIHPGTSLFLPRLLLKPLGGGQSSESWALCYS
ncbi:hypothetical protein AMTRI_Chr02g218100 [Amborella trichopoda]